MKRRAQTTRHDNLHAANYRADDSWKSFRLRDRSKARDDKSPFNELDKDGLTAVAFGGCRSIVQSPHNEGNAIPRDTVG